MKISEHLRISAKSVKLIFSLSRVYVVCTFLHSLIEAVLPYVPIYFSARLLDALWEGRPVETLAFYAALTVGLVFLLNMVKTYISSRRSVAFEEMYRNEDWMYSEKAMQMAFASVEDPEVARLCERIRMESQTGYNLFHIHQCEEKLIHDLIQIIMSVSLTASFFAIKSVTLPMKLFFVAGMILTVLCGMYTAQKDEKMCGEFWTGCVDLNIQSGKIRDYVKNYSSGKDIRMYDMQDGLYNFLMDLNMGLCRQNHWLNIKRCGLGVMNIVMNGILRVGIYMMLIYASMQGSVSVGSIAQYVSCMMLLLSAFSGVVVCLQATAVNNVHMEKYFSYFEIPNNMYQGTLTVEKRDDNDYFVEFQDVSFRYPNTEEYALRHVSLKFKVGEKLAVVGMNGSGKTTFIKLMCRMYDPTEGVILLNGVDIRKYDYDEYLSIFSVVFQDFRLFAFQLGQNVATSPHYDARRAEQCLRKAGLGERLADMPGGLSTYLYKDFDKDGVEISGGEAQKIALARALYKNAPFMILDEPTAALDPVSEYEVYSGFNRIAGDRTAIYISHRLASCRFCDKIAVFDQGRIVQTGIHDQLLAQKDGKYYELWQAQAQYYTEGAAAGG